MKIKHEKCTDLLITRGMQVKISLSLHFFHLQNYKYQKNGNYYGSKCGVKYALIKWLVGMAISTSVEGNPAGSINIL